MFPSAVGKKICSKPAEQGESGNRSAEAEIAQLNASSSNMPQHQPRPHGQKRLRSSPSPLPRPAISNPVLQQTLEPNLETSFATPRPAPLPPSGFPINYPLTVGPPNVYARPPPTARILGHPTTIVTIDPTSTQAEAFPVYTHKMQTGQSAEHLFTTTDRYPTETEIFQAYFEHMRQLPNHGRQGRDQRIWAWLNALPDN